MASLLALVLLFTACAEAQEPLRYRFETGEILRYEYTLSNQTEMGEGVLLEETMIWDFELRVKKTEASGTELDFVLERVRAKGPTITYDSEKPEDTFAFDPRPELFARYLKTPYSVTFSSRGEIEVSGVEEHMKKLIKELEGDATMQMGLLQYRVMYTDHFLAVTLGNVFPLLPEGTPKPDLAWKRNHAFIIPIIGDLVVEDRYRIEDPAQGLIQQEITVASYAKKLTMLGMGMNVRIDEGKGTGESHFSSATGRLVRSSRETFQTFGITRDGDGEQEMKLSAKLRHELRTVER